MSVPRKCTGAGRISASGGAPSATGGGGGGGMISVQLFELDDEGSLVINDDNVLYLPVVGSTEIVAVGGIVTDATMLAGQNPIFMRSADLLWNVDGVSSDDVRASVAHPLCLCRSPRLRATVVLALLPSTKRSS